MDESTTKNRTLSILTQNLYLGADTKPVIFAHSCDEVPGLVDAVYKQMLENNFQTRAKGMAEALREDPPDVIALQEVARWQATCRFSDGKAQAGTTTDFLEILLSELREVGLHYRAEATALRGEVTLPGILHSRVRLLNRDVLLVAEHLQVRNSAKNSYQDQACVQLGGESGTRAYFRRGWIAVDLSLDERLVRILNTHLELAGPQQPEQVVELLKTVQASPYPVLIAGDFNIDFNLAQEGLKPFLKIPITDVWSELEQHEEGCTGCQGSDLRNESSMLNERLDAIFCADTMAPLRATRLGSDEGDRVTYKSDKLWPSDHAGVQATVSMK